MAKENEEIGYDIPTTPIDSPEQDVVYGSIKVGENRISDISGLFWKQKTITATTYYVEQSDVVLFLDAPTAPDIILPLAQKGKVVIIKNIANNIASVYANNANQSVYDGTPITLALYESAMFIADGTNWGQVSEVV